VINEDCPYCHKPINTNARHYSSHVYIGCSFCVDIWENFNKEQKCDFSFSSFCAILRDQVRGCECFRCSVKIGLLRAIDRSVDEEKDVIICVGCTEDFRGRVALGDYAQNEILKWHEKNLSKITGSNTEIS